MQGVLCRALQTGIISQATYKSLYMTFSYKGWRKQEPNAAYPSEETRLFKQLVYRALAENYFTESKAAELLGLSVAKFHQQRMLDVETVTH